MDDLVPNFYLYTDEEEFFDEIDSLTVYAPTNANLSIIVRDNIISFLFDYEEEILNNTKYCNRLFELAFKYNNEYFLDWLDINDINMSSLDSKTYRRLYNYSVKNNNYDLINEIIIYDQDVYNIELFKKYCYENDLLLARKYMKNINNYKGACNLGIYIQVLKNISCDNDKVIKFLLKDCNFIKTYLISDLYEVLKNIIKPKCKFNNLYFYYCKSFFVHPYQTFIMHDTFRTYDTKKDLYNLIKSHIKDDDIYLEKYLTNIF